MHFANSCPVESFLVSCVHKIASLHAHLHHRLWCAKLVSFDCFQKQIVKKTYCSESTRIPDGMLTFSKKPTALTTSSYAEISHENLLETSEPRPLHSHQNTWLCTPEGQKWPEMVAMNGYYRPKRESALWKIVECGPHGGNLEYCSVCSSLEASSFKVLKWNNLNLLEGYWWQ